MERFRSLAKMEGFTGSLELGEAVRPCGASCANDDEMDVDDIIITPGETDHGHGGAFAGGADDSGDESESEDEGDDAYDAYISDILYDLAGLGLDDEERRCTLCLPNEKRTEIEVQGAKGHQQWNGKKKRASGSDDEEKHPSGSRTVIDPAVKKEEEIGQALKESGVPREELWLTSKLWNTFHEPADIEPALDDTLKKLGTDYLDLYLIHWPLAQKNGQPYNKTLTEDPTSGYHPP
ncbi:Aldo-keto reductase [Mycena indigotica]|uniref:Aldo-keto reductase n=1 Tax=Mycena indigotica TaxID=2126181 RepID=A0A8H6VTU4_9AGAR|nr:Aldo-keto reductase [Mycena indigotica]KAF7293699.1 Aldo-keto reductase [Mycena indigotica]